MNDAEIIHGALRESIIVAAMKVLNFRYATLTWKRIIR